MTTLDLVLALLNGIVYLLGHWQGTNRGLARTAKVLETYPPRAPEPVRLTAAEWAARGRDEEITAREGKVPSQGPML